MSPASLPPEQRPEAWHEAVAAAPTDPKTGKKKVTGKHVRKIAAKRKARDDAKAGDKLWSGFNAGVGEVVSKAAVGTPRDDQGAGGRHGHQAAQEQLGALLLVRRHGRRNQRADTHDGEGPARAGVRQAARLHARIPPSS